jgi:hypothetical protein
MFRFLPGIILVEAAAITMLLLFPDFLQQYNWAKIGVLLLVLGVLVSLWFKSIALHINKDEITQLKEDFARERETLKVKAEREKHKLIRQTHKQITKETRRAQSVANMKVTTAFAGVAGVGALLLFTQFMTIGLLAVSSAGGAAFGYFARLRQESRNQLPGEVNPPAIEQKKRRPRTLPGIGGRSQSK